jgi:RNA polymerase sigma-70 factor (ECF subfamily)
LHEVELIRLAQAGDSQAFAALMDQHRSTLTGTAYLILRDPQLVEDAVQEALVQVWRGLPSYRPTGSFRGWVVTILVNQIHKLRRKHRVPTVPLEGMEALLEDARHDEDVVLLNDDRRQVRIALQSLTSDQREVVILRYYGDLTVPEIARMLGSPEGTVKSRLSRALDRLSAVLTQAGIGRAEA